MCGIAGFFVSQVTQFQDPFEDIARAMASRLAHRGPDDQGVWVDKDRGIGLAHRRLSILDLSPEGHQPMASVDGRYQLSFNGEIYNFLDLRRELELAGFRFRGGSDTEVLLAALQHWGPEQTLQRIDGMFVFAAWDAQEGRLLLARDRYGKKPLYYGRVGQAWVFASELKAFFAFPGFSPQIDLQAQADYFRFGYVPAPRSIYQQLRKLEPASAVWLDGSAGWPVVTPFWRLPAWQAAGEPATLEEVEAALRAAVARRMVADVPLGAFLSGGIDSSLITALMQERSSRPVQTFCIGFEEASHDEAPYARRVAAALGTDHHEFLVSAREALAVVPSLSRIYDEPFSDPSAIPTFLVSQHARRQVTVVLSGDGGDEVFGGYNRYFWGPRIWNLLRLAPAPLRRLLARLLGALPARWLEGALRGRVSYPQEKWTKFCTLLGARDARDVYRLLTASWSQSGRSDSLLETLPWQGDFLKDMMVLDSLTYLPDDILVKVDRASMAVSLEARAPFLDSQLAEVAWRLPKALKVQGTTGKVALRQLLYRRLPEELFRRPKAGFSMPLGSWLRNELRPWAEEGLAGLRRQGVFETRLLDERWSQHLAGTRDWTQSLWTLLCFQAWTEAQGKP